MSDESVVASIPRVRKASLKAAGVTFRASVAAEGTDILV